MSAVPARRIDAERLWKGLDEMGRIGGLPNGGCSRLALTDEDRDARNLFASWCRGAGCRVEIDEFGNLFAIRPGTQEDAPLVLFGSHLDTQPNGGRFDGIYGVLAGLEVMRTLDDAGVRTERPLAVVNWSNEEGVRFSPGLTGSKGFAGFLPAAALADLKSSEGVSFADELERIGYRGVSRTRAAAAYLEAHIEQGPVLESLQQPVGVVTAVQGVRWFEVAVCGADRHAGTTPMRMRRDSFMAASRIVLAARTAALAMAADVCFTVGRVRVEPGSVNTVPGRSVFSIDLRHPDSDLLDRVEAALADIAATEAKAESCTARVERIFNLPPTEFNRSLVDTVAGAARSRGLVPVRMVSGAMHDACPVSQVVPTAMIFTACRQGISHSEEEWAEPGDLASGCQVLLDAVLAVSKFHRNSGG